MSIKVIENIERWKVMLRASEGEQIAYWDNERQEWLKSFDGFRDQNGIPLPLFGVRLAIIDTTTPEINWDDFNWDFFNQYGGLLTCFNYGSECDNMIVRSTIECGTYKMELRESPPYPWQGGECPLPDGIEVEVTYRYGERDKAGVPWSHTNGNYDIIAFKLIGN